MNASLFKTRFTFQCKSRRSTLPSKICRYLGQNRVVLIRKQRGIEVTRRRITKSMLKEEAITGLTPILNSIKWESTSKLIPVIVQVFLMFLTMLESNGV